LKLAKLSSVLALLSGSCGVIEQGALQPLAPKAFAIAQLGALFFWICLAVFVLVLGASVYAFARSTRRARGSELTPLSPAVDGEQRLAQAVTASTLVSLVLLAVLLVASIATGRDLDGKPVKEPLRVKITAHQWWWQIEYPGSRPDEQVATANELHIPAGRPVELELTSADVIHSFWLPNLDGKHDLIPSHVVKTVISAERTGAYAGRCAEFCGYQHAHMDLLLVAQTPSEFEAWLVAQRQPAAEPKTTSQQHGRELVERGACALCHTIAGTKALGGTGPDLTHLASRRTLAAGAATRDRAALSSWIQNPQRLKPGSQMPTIDLAPADLAAVVDYLEALP
jgi:cytochrome c oxidase subunit II